MTAPPFACALVLYAQRVADLRVTSILAYIDRHRDAIIPWLSDDRLRRK